MITRKEALKLSPKQAMEMLDALQKSVEHWERMIAAAKKFSAGGIPITHEMYRVTGETWAGGYCPLCDLYHRPPRVVFDAQPCKACPISEGLDRCTSAWFAVDAARTWREWITAANALVKLLKRKQKLIESVASTRWTVRWEIDVLAGTAEEAARKARASQLEGTTALVFDVYRNGQCKRVDLMRGA